MTLQLIGRIAVLVALSHSALAGKPPVAPASRSASSPPTAAAAVVRRAPIDDIRGITVSCWRWGYEWASPGMHDLMASLPQVGANWLTIHPYAHVSRETGEVRWTTSERTDHITSPIRWAKQLGLKIMIKPHIAYWGEFSWCGDVGWGDDEVRWQRFLTSHRAWIVYLAGIAEDAGADLFVVGTELRQAESRVDYWRELIGSVRAVYSGPITYAANWDDYDRIVFWNDLDYIGVQAYFPLSTKGDPDEATLRAGWTEPMAGLARVSKRFGRRVILTEVGYSNGSAAAERPWETSRERVTSDLQARCLRVALEVAHAQPHIVGAFIWKWFPTLDDIGPYDFTVQTADFKRLLREVWSRGVQDSAKQPAE